MRGAVAPLRQYVFMIWCLIKHRNNSIFIKRIVFMDFIHRLVSQEQKNKN